MENNEIILLIFQQDVHHDFQLLIYTMLRGSFQLTAQDMSYVWQEAMLSMLPFRMVRFGNKSITIPVNTEIPQENVVPLRILSTTS